VALYNSSLHYSRKKPSPNAGAAVLSGRDRLVCRLQQRAAYVSAFRETLSIYYRSYFTPTKEKTQHHHKNKIHNK